MTATLLIVYNADEGLAAALFDAAHKMVAPGTYPCSLCAVSYGAVRMRPAWRAFLRALPYPVRFHHRPDFARAYPALAAMPLPAILLDDDGEVRTVVDAATLGGIADVPALIAATRAGLAG